MNGKAGQSPSDFRDLSEEMNTETGVEDEAHKCEVF